MATIAFLFAQGPVLPELPQHFGLYVVGAVVAFCFLVFLILVLTYGKLWFQAYMSMPALA